MCFMQMPSGGIFSCLAPNFPFVLLDTELRVKVLFTTVLVS